MVGQVVRLRPSTVLSCRGVAFPYRASAASAAMRRGSSSGRGDQCLRAMRPSTKPARPSSALFNCGAGSALPASCAADKVTRKRAEPTGTVGRMNGTTRVIEAGVIAKYVLGDPMAPWHGGSASLSSAFIGKYPNEAKKYIAAYAKGIEYVRTKPAEARQYLKGYTAIEGPLTNEVPLAAYMLHSEFTKSDVAYFQKFFDLFAEKGIFTSRLMVEPMLYKA